MNTTNQKRYYSPQFTPMASVSVRRLAWALGLSMPQTVDYLIKGVSSVFVSSAVCSECKDKTKCNLCSFNQQNAAENAAKGA
jgi:recombinational DNA repair protein RecR